MNALALVVLLFGLITVSAPASAVPIVAVDDLIYYEDCEQWPPSSGGEPCQGAMCITTRGLPLGWIGYDSCGNY